MKSKSHSGSKSYVFFRNFGSYKKIVKNSKFYFGPGSPKNRFYDFSGNFTRKIGDTGISSETTIPGISSETTILCAFGCHGGSGGWPGGSGGTATRDGFVALRREFPATLQSSRSSLPLLARCQIRLQAGRSGLLAPPRFFSGFVLLCSRAPGVSLVVPGFLASHS